MKRKFSDEDRNFKRLDTNFNKRPVQAKKFNHNSTRSLNDKFANDNHQMNRSSDELKSGFNKLFAFKGKMKRNDDRFNDNSIERFKSTRDLPDRSNDRKGFISNLFRSDPDIPEIRL